MSEKVARPGIVARELEVALLAGFVAGERAARGLVLTGAAGVGKTTLWEEGVAAAQQAGLHVLVARASDSELQLSFVAVSDFFSEVELAELTGLPVPQRRALEVALLRAEPDGRAAEPRAVSAGFTTALRLLSEQQPLLIALDDPQWLDASSSEALCFAARRLGGFPVRFLLARRSGRASELERVLEPGGLERIQVEGMSLGAIRRLLAERLGLTLPRHLLRRVFESSAGNPLFALELGRILAERGVREIGAELPAPEVADELFGERIRELPAPLRRIVLAVAVSGELADADAEGLADAATFGDAIDRELLVVENGRVRVSHPLLAAAARRNSRVGERRALHRELAGLTTDPQQRARHLALATQGPSAEVSAEVTQAAQHAFGRGARREAIELAEHALRLTPPAEAERSDRLLQLAEYLTLAAEGVRVTELLSPVLETLHPAAARVRACLLLAGGVITGNDDVQRHHQRALAEAGENPELRAAVLAEIASNTVAIRVERVPAAEGWAMQALADAPGDDPSVERWALYALAWARSLLGREVDDLSERFVAVSAEAFSVSLSPERIAGQRLVWRGEVQDARAVFLRLLSLADAQNEPYSYALLRLHLCELELRTGNWERAEALLDEWAESFAQEIPIWPMWERCQALLAAMRGLPENAERWTSAAIARAETTGNRWDWLEARRAGGITALLEHDPARAVDHLRPVWQHLQKEGIADPGAFPVAPDLVEALLELTELGEAHTVAERLRELADEQRHPWGLACANRCQGLLRFATQSDVDRGEAELADSAKAATELGLRFDAARSLLCLGRSQRRLKRWGAARATLAEAVNRFEEIGSPGWAEQPRGELARVGARRPAPRGALTSTEEQVARLAADGLSNKQIAAQLVVSVYTIEKHLTHAFEKLGVRSRSQLAARLGTSP